MSRLVWRIFIAFWLVIILTVIVTVSVNTFLFRDELSVARLQLVFASMDALAEDAQRTLDAEGETGLRAWLEARQAELDIPMLIVSPAGRELLGRPVPPLLQVTGERRPRFAPGLRPPDFEREGSRRPMRRPPEPSILTSQNGDYRFLVMGLDRNLPPRSFMTPSARRMFPLVLVLLSGAACFLLARYLTRPINTFRVAGQQIAAGNLAARVGAPVAARKDEFGALARDFDNMAERVEALLGAQKRLLRDVSHELRSPLARLQAAVELIRQQGATADNANLDRIELEAGRLNEMIGQILTFTRLETMAEIRRDSVDVAELVADVVENAEFEASALGRSVTLSAPAAILAELDSVLVQSALDNVIRNAVQHARSLVTVSLSAADDLLRIEVADDGPGAGPETLGRLFEPFYTNAPSNSAEGKGVGIGLAIAQRAVELHGGTIVAANRQDASGSGGLIVTITLPLRS